MEIGVPIVHDAANLRFIQTRGDMSNDCILCRHYWNNPQLAEEICRHGVTFGTHPVASASIRTMRDDHWWGKASCGEDGRFWEQKDG